MKLTGTADGDCNAPAKRPGGSRGKSPIAYDPAGAGPEKGLEICQREKASRRHPGRSEPSH